MVTEAIASPHGQSNDYHERNNYMFFYEKMEALVEAAWIMNQGPARLLTRPDRPLKNKTMNGKIQL
jgi:hypothetical protein